MSALRALLVLMLSGEAFAAFFAAAGVAHGHPLSPGLQVTYLLLLMCNSIAFAVSVMFVMTGRGKP